MDTQSFLQLLRDLYSHQRVSTEIKKTLVTVQVDFAQLMANTGHPPLSATPIVLLIGLENDGCPVSPSGCKGARSGWSVWISTRTATAATLPILW